MPSRQPAVSAEPAPVRAQPEVREAAAPAGGEPTPSEAAAQVAQAAAPAEPVAPVPSPVPPAAGADDADVLVLKYEADCWTAVQDADGKRLAYDLVKAGQVLNLQGKAPFRVTLGNAPAVNVQINGEPFDTVRFSRGRIARFQIPAGA
jgi:cytoskeleton protein RodZ